jgi:hypothetical protein
MNRLSTLFSFSLRSFLLLFLVTACSSSPEKEIKNWKKNVVDLEESMRIYPNLKGALTANLNQASQLWKKAQGITDPKMQIKAMQDANAMARQMVSPLRQIESKLDTVQRRVTEISRMRLKGNLIMKRERALEGLDRSVQAVRKALTQTPMQDPLQAGPFLKQNVTQATNVWRRSDSVLKQFRKLKRSQGKSLKSRLKQKGKKLINNSGKTAIKGALKPVIKSTFKKPSKLPAKPMPRRTSKSKKSSSKKSK